MSLAIWTVLSAAGASIKGGTGTGGEDLDEPGDCSYFTVSAVMGERFSPVGSGIFSRPDVIVLVFPRRFSTVCPTVVKGSKNRCFPLERSKRYTRRKPRLSHGKGDHATRISLSTSAFRQADTKT
ncbi:hypothetical protein [Amycolatopsis orientalis]|uniref:hypothetical protein n=1 Tax=Amycolatopsis orientalis TaxID=31958 RepID=UPI0011AB7E38|nr:hypothetical protein [Amycolatopsis orientalis]